MKFERAKVIEEGLSEVDSVDISSDSGPSLLYEEVKQMPPTFKNNADAIKVFHTELEALAAKHGLSINALIERADDSSMFVEDYDRALSLFRKIAFLKK